MKSCERVPECLYENSRNQDRNPLSSVFFKSMKLFLDYAFMLLPAVLHRSEFTSEYSLHLAVSVFYFIGLYGKKYVPALVIAHLAPLNPHNRKCVMLLNKADYCIIFLSVINAILPGSTVSGALRDMKINNESLVIFQEKN